MMFKVAYHHLVVRDDIPRFSSEWKGKIRRAVEERLMAQPDLYGKPLRKSLKGYRKLRVSDYRVIFHIDRTEVKVLAIQHRSVVYTEAEKRI